MPALPIKEIADNRYPAINEKKAMKMTKIKFLFKFVIYVQQNKVQQVNLQKADDFS